MIEKDKLFYSTFDSPWGEMTCGLTSFGLAFLQFNDESNPNSALKKYCAKNSLSKQKSKAISVDEIRKELMRYSEGEVLAERELDLRGTPFQMEVWKSLFSISRGATISYKKQALRLQKPQAIRAIARANGANPIAIYVPCHRIIGSDGSLTGYAGGLQRKTALLELEGAMAPRAVQTQLF